MTFGGLGVIEEEGGAVGEEDVGGLGLRGERYFFAHGAELTRQFRHVRGDGVGDEDALFTPAVYEGVEEGVVFFIVRVLRFAGFPGAGLAVADAFDPVGGEGDGFDAVAEVHLFDLGAEEVPEVAGVARGTADDEFARGGGQVDTLEFDAHAADAALAFEEFAVEAGEEILNGEGNGFELRGGAFENTFHRDGVGYSERVDHFAHAAHRLVEAEEEFFAEAGEKAFAGEGEEVPDAFDADLLQAGGGFRGDAEGGDREGFECFLELIFADDGERVRAEAGQGPGGADGGGDCQARGETDAMETGGDFGEEQMFAAKQVRFAGHVEE